MTLRLVRNTSPGSNTIKENEAPHNSLGKSVHNRLLHRALLLIQQHQVGAARQAQALATSLGYEADTVFVKPVWWGYGIPRRFWWSSAVRSVDATPLTMSSPPKLAIGAGAYGAAALAAFGRRWGRHTFKIALMNPRMPLKAFDAVVAPLHDNLHGKHVINTLLSPHMLHAKFLKQQAQQWQKHFSDIPLPRVGVLLGGKSHNFAFGVGFAQQLGRQLKRLHAQTGAGFLITPSRRTPPASLLVLKDTLQETPHFLWDGQGDNPYYGVLGCADALMVTGDSVQMISEAAATEVPLYIIHASGLSKRHAVFHAMLYQKGIARPFCGCLESWLRSAQYPLPGIVRDVKKLLYQHTF